MPKICLLLPMLLLGCGHSGAVRDLAPTGSPEAAENDPGIGPAPLSHGEIAAGMQTALHRVRACPVDPRGSAPPVIRITVAPSGRISEARTIGPMSVNPTASCIEREIKLIAFRSNPGISFDYMFPLP